MKSEKIPFRVVEATGWEEGYPARDLELHSPWVKGWRAPRYCLFPQEVVLSLPRVLTVRTLQILSHQHLIASKVEVLVGRAREGRAAVLPNAVFSRLGYVTFGDNHSSNYRMRELKSIPLDVTCQFIKIRFHQNHINHLNPFNQVGVVAVNIIGEPAKKITHQQEVGLEGQPTHENRDVNQVVHSYLPGYHSNQLAVPAVRAADDLAFAIYQDPETGGLIRHLQWQKDVAVSGEDFSRAKLLKQAIVDLQKVGEVLAQFAVEKQRAVETENYEAAEECKEKADRLRVHVYRQLNVFGLVEDTSVLGRHASVLQPAPATAGSVSLRPQEGCVGRSPRPSPSPLYEEASDAPEVSQASCPGVAPTVASSEDRPLPTLANKGSTSAAVPRQDDEGIAGPDKLNESALNEATLPIQVFGMELVECVYAKQFVHRERALRDISASLAALTAGSPRKDVAAMAKAIAILLRRLLADKMAAGFQTACALLVALFDSVEQKLQKHFSCSDIEALVNKTFPILLGRLGDSAPRVVQQASETILEVLKNNSLEDLPAAADQLTEPLGKQAAWRALLGRLALLRQVVGRGGVKGHLTVGKAMQVVLPSLEHAHGQVRDAAVQLTLELYQVSPAEVRRSLPVDTPTLRKSLLWRTLMEGLDQIDGKPSSRQLKVAKQEQEKARMDELADMQKELLGLRQLADQVADTTSKTLSSGTQKEVRFRPSPSSRSQDRRQEEDHACIFCGATGSEFAEEALLNRHYLKYCAMLYQCPHCTQVVEIAALHEHWLTECKEKRKFRKCPRCKEAVLATQYPTHITAKTCKVPSGNQRRCALCHMCIVNDEDGWRGHLMGGKSCKNNPRKPQKSPTHS